MTGSVFTASGLATTNSKVSFLPQSAGPVIIDGTWYISRAVTTTATNGFFTTPLVVGKYLMMIDQSTRDQITIYAPHDTDTYNFRNLTTNNISWALSNYFGFMLAPVKTNGVNVGTNGFRLNFNYGITGAVANGTYNLGVSVAGGGSGNMTALVDGTAITNFIQKAHDTNAAQTDGMIAITNAVLAAHDTNAIQQLALAGLTNAVQANRDTNASQQLALSGLTNLIQLNRDTNASQQTALAGLTNLVQLAADTNASQQAAVVGLTNLVQANRDTNASQQTALIGLTNLIQLNRDTNASQQTALVGLTNLIQLAHDTNAVQQAALAGLTNLVQLNRDTNASQQAALTGLTNLVQLAADTNAAQQAALVGLTNLVQLNRDTNAAQQSALSGLTNIAAGKQQGSFILTNFIAMGVTNFTASGDAVATTNNGVFNISVTTGAGSQNTNTLPVFRATNVLADSFSTLDFFTDSLWVTNWIAAAKLTNSGDTYLTGLTGTGPNLHVNSDGLLSRTNIQGGSGNGTILGTNGITVFLSNSTSTVLSQHVRQGANMTIVTNSDGSLTYSASSSTVDGNLSSLVVTNTYRFLTKEVIASTTNTIIDFSSVQNVRLLLLTNTSLIFTNVADGILSWLNVQQDTNGGWAITRASVAGGNVITNGPVWNYVDTNASGLTRFDLVSYYSTNIIAFLRATYSDVVTATQQLAAITQPLSTKLTALAGTGAVTNQTTNDIALNGLLILKAGQSASNVYVGGMYFSDQSAYTNLNSDVTAFTNLCSVPVPANMLTNLGDTVVIRWDGQHANLAANTNNFTIVSGALTLFDSGLLLSSNRAWTCEATLRRVDATNIRVLTTMIQPGTAVATVAVTNSLALATLATGTNNSFALRVSARRGGATTNNSTFAEYKPAPRIP